MYIDSLCKSASCLMLAAVLTTHYPVRTLRRAAPALMRDQAAGDLSRQWQGAHRQSQVG